MSLAAANHPAHHNAPPSTAPPEQAPAVKKSANRDTATKKPAFQAGLYVPERGAVLGSAITTETAEHQMAQREISPIFERAVTTGGITTTLGGAGPKPPPISHISIVRSSSLSLAEDGDGDICQDEEELLSAEGGEHNNHERERQGLCLNCGKKLFAIKTKKKGLFGQKKEAVRVPLSIPGEVQRGQCLRCCAGTTSSSSSQQEHQQHTIASNGGDSYSSLDHHMAHMLSLSENAQQNSNDTSTDHQNHSSTAVYEGSFNVYGERDGKGSMTWENGDVYTGAFFNGNRHGHGTLQFSDGSEYVGEWECNEQHGVGTRRWNNGDCYTGQYCRGKRTGEGRFYFANGDLYTGQWEDGVMEGFGRYYYSNGQRFEGQFSKGIRRGKGKLQRTDGSLDIGVYCDDRRCGTGVRWSADRTQAWRMCDGVVKKKITVPEAVALDYDMDAQVEALEREAENEGMV